MDNNTNNKVLDFNKPLKFNKGHYDMVAKVAFPDDNAKYKDVDFKFRIDCKTSMSSEMLNVLNTFDERTWTSTNKGIDTGFPLLNNAFQNGMPSGFYIVAADSNVGKTTFTTQLSWQMLKHNDDIFVLDFSLDDPIIDKISRLVGSLVMINSKKVKFPNGESDLILSRRAIGLTKLANNSDKYLCRDCTFGSSIEKIESEIERVKIDLEVTRPDTKLIVFIDSFHDLCIDAEPNLSEATKFNKIAQWAADIAIKHDLVLVCTAELRKMEKDNIRPNLNSIRESVKIRYEAKAIMLLYNDVHYNQDSAEIFRLDNKQRKCPVLEVHIAKNKISSWKGRLFYNLFADEGHLVECDEDNTKNYNKIIYK